MDAPKVAPGWEVHTPWRMVSSSPNSDTSGGPGDTLGIRLPIDFVNFYQIAQSTSSTESYSEGFTQDPRLCLWRLACGVRTNVAFYGSKVSTKFRQIHWLWIVGQNFSSDKRTHMYNVRMEFGQIQIPWTWCNTCSRPFQVSRQQRKSFRATFSSEKCDKSKVAMKNRKYVVF